MNSPQQIRQFILAGNALFTFKSLRTGKHFTFKVRGVEPQAGVSPPTHWNVSVLCGRDNTHNYKWIGRIDREMVFFGGLEHTESFRAFNWCWEHLERCGERFEFRHCGRCGRCGRLLTVPSSVDSGIGPECQDRLDFEAMGGAEGLLGQLFGG
jgi:hypothetical protein